MRRIDIAILTAQTALMLALASYASASDDAPRKLWIYGGADAGPGLVSTGQSALVEPNKTGMQLDLKGLGSVDLDHWIVDAGGGWRYNRFSGEVGTMGDQTITTRSGFVELGGRYKFGERWSIGPTASYAFGADQSLGTGLNDKSGAWMGGLQAFYEVPLSSASMRLRVGARGLVDLDIPGRDITAFQLGIQIGFGVGKGAETPQPALIQAPIAALPIEERPVAEQKINLVIGDIHFQTGKAELMPQTKEILSKLGGFLKEHGSAWGSLTVDGHTDRRGSMALNQRLSERRAAAVVAAMAAGGLEAERAKARGLSYTKPLVEGNDSKAWQKNRRVELNFAEVADRTLIRDYIGKVQVELKQSGIGAGPSISMAE